MTAPTTPTKQETKNPTQQPKRRGSAPAIQLPKFTPSSPLPAFGERAVSPLTMPAFSAQARLVMRGEEKKESPRLPGFVRMTAPTTPTKQETKNPTQQPKRRGSAPAIQLPKFTPSSPLPAFGERAVSPLTMPAFSAQARLVMRGEEKKESPRLPGFVRMTPPQAREEERSPPSPPQFASYVPPVVHEEEFFSPLPPHFSPITPPTQERSPLYPVDPPLFVSPEPPRVRHPHTRRLPSASPHVEHHLRMQQWELLWHKLGLEQILKKAAEADTLPDLRMLRKHPHLKTRYFRYLLDNKRREIPFALPKHETFYTERELEQEQLELLADFCAVLVKARQWNDLPEKIRFDLPASYFPRDPKGKIQAILELKESVYFFLCEVLSQEKKQARRFLPDVKDLSTLTAALAALKHHIEEESESLIVESIRSSAFLDFAPWEERTPQPIVAVRTATPQVPVTIPGLEAGLQVIRKKPKMWQLLDFTYQVFSLPETNVREAEVKTHYLVELGKVYVSHRTVSALKRAIQWYDVAIETLSRFVADNSNRVLLECYAYRGEACLAIAQHHAQKSVHEETVARRWIDHSYRDFYLSHEIPLPSGKNFVRRLKEAQNLPLLESALIEIEGVVSTDSDYAEAAYHHLLKTYEQLRLDSIRIMHPQFESLIGASPDVILKRFASLLTDDPDRDTTLKITFSSGTLILRWSQEALLINTLNQELLVELLSKGAKRVEPLHKKNENYYFAEPISGIAFHALVQSMTDYQKRWQGIERGMRLFHDFELAALYKSSLVVNEETLDLEVIWSRLPPVLILQMIELGLMASRIYVHLGNHFSEHTFFATALTYTCRAIRECDRVLKSRQRDSSLIEKRLDLLIKRAVIYGKMGLLNSQISALEEAIDYGKKQNPHFFNPSLHEALGWSYMELNQFGEARYQFYLALNARKKSFEKHHDGIEMALKTIEELEKKPPPLPPEDSDVLARFQEHNILQECLQVIRDNYRANSGSEPCREVAYWNDFVDRVMKTTTIQEFCEAILSTILVSHEVTAAHLLNIARVGNLVLHDVKILDEMKKYLHDAEAFYIEEERKKEDLMIPALQEAQEATRKAEEFENYRKEFVKKIREGERIRLGSPAREAMQNLLSHILLEGECPLPVLEEISGLTPPIGLEVELEVMVETLENALDLETAPLRVKDNVLEVAGNNVFLSKLKREIEATCKRRSDIHDVHVVGVNVYVDTSIQLQGINLAIGGEYIECIVDQGVDGRGRPGLPLVIDLSGKPGEGKRDLYGARARDGANPTEAGADGLLGEDGEGGDAGGTFALSAKVPVVGLEPAIIQEINVRGGDGGRGSRGQDGGNGGNGKAGANARTDIRRGDPADTIWGHRDVRRGGRGIPAGDGGQGGDEGIGGKGGASGRVLIEQDINAIKDRIKEGAGKDGAEGGFGIGGKPGKPEPDGFDYVIVKGGLFNGQHKFPGYGLECHKRNDREKDSWRDTITRDETIRRNQGREKGRGKTIAESHRKRKEKSKNQLKGAAFKARLDGHLHTQSGANKAFAFDDVTNKRAQAHDTEEVLTEALSAKQRKIKNIEALHQRTAMLLQQTQAVQQAQKQHSRQAAYQQKGHKKDHGTHEILRLWRHPEVDAENLLPLNLCSPVPRNGPRLVHELEYALYAVNVTRGEDMPAIAQLIEKARQFERDPTCLTAPFRELMNRLVSVIQAIQPHNGMIGFEQVVAAVKGLDDTHPLSWAVDERESVITKFQRLLRAETDQINENYNAQLHQLQIKKTILRFLRSDRLSLTLLMQEFPTKKRVERERLFQQHQRERWFQQRLREKVRVTGNAVTGKALSMEHRKEFVEYANRQIDTIKQRLMTSSPETPAKTVGKVLKEERDAHQQSIQKLKGDQQWILIHLPQLLAAGIRPTLVCQAVGLDSLYGECTQRWAQQVPQGQKAPPRQEVPSDPVSSVKKRMDAAFQSHWSLEKKRRFEAHVQQIVLHIGEKADPFIETLKKVYQEAETFSGLEEVYVAFVLAKLQGWPERARELKSDDSELIYSFRQQYWRPIHSDAALALNHLYQKLSIYLCHRHLYLVQKLWANPGLAPAKEILDTFALQLDALFRYQELIPGANFLAIGAKIVEEKGAELCSALMQRAQQHRDLEQIELELPDLMQLVLERVVDPILGKVNLRDVQDTVERFRGHLHRGEIKQSKASLFLLLHMETDYDSLISLVKELENSSVCSEPWVQKGMTLLIRRLNLLKTQFETQREAVFERARNFDRVRMHYQEDHRNTIESTLMEIAEEADLLPEVEKIEVLNEIIQMVSSYGCFTVLPHLKKFHRNKATKIGQFSLSAAQSSPQRVAYNQALKDQADDALRSLFMEVVTRDSFEGSFLIPTLIATHHIPFSVEELLVIYKKVRDYEAHEKEEKEFQATCVREICEKLRQELKKEYTALTQKRGEVHQKLHAQQTKILEKIRDAITSSQLLHPDRHTAQVELWMKLLDLHLGSSDDSEGNERLTLYSEAYDLFIKEMGSLDTEVGIRRFHSELRVQFNHKVVHDNTDVDVLIRSLEKVDSKTPPEALERLNRLWWRGTVPYEEVVTRIDDLQIEETTQERIKLKFDDEMIQEECYEVRKALEKREEEHQKKIAEWLSHIDEALESGKNVEEVYPSQEDLTKAIQGQKVPSPPPSVAQPVEESEEINGSLHLAVQRIILAGQIQDSQVGIITQFLQEIYESIVQDTIDPIDEEVLKNLKDFVEAQKKHALKAVEERIRELELRLIEVKDQKEKKREERIDAFIDYACTLNRVNLRKIKSIENEILKRKLKLSEVEDLNLHQIVDDRKQLKESLKACTFLLGEVFVFKAMDRLTESLASHRAPVRLPMLTQVFWTLPKIPYPAAFDEIVKTKIPEHWGVGLLVVYCQAMVLPAIGKMGETLPSLQLKEQEPEQKDKMVEEVLKGKREQCQACLKSFQAVITDLVETRHLKKGDKEALLRLLGDRLGLLSQEKLQFSIEAFVQLVEIYLKSPEVLQKLSVELSLRHSIIANALFLPSYEGLKYGLTLAWLQANLEPFFQLPKADQNKLYDTLLEIETVKRNETMRAVVEALRGKVITPAVVEGVVKWAQGSWELDETTLGLMRNRTEDGGWYRAIENYTKEKRSREQTLEMLVKNMADEVAGINASVKELVTGDLPPMVTALQTINDLIKKPVKEWPPELKRLMEVEIERVAAMKPKKRRLPLFDGPVDTWPAVGQWSAAQVSRWAAIERGNTFLDDPNRVLLGIAVVSRGSQLIEGHLLRNNQMIALWLMLRPTPGVDKGRISQMATGQGKSITFACMVILRVMSNTFVNLVSTSSVLAERDAEENEEIFALFGMTVANNCDTQCEADDELRKKRYFNNDKPVDIIYGEAGCFERDLLLTEFHGQGIIHPSRMEGRKAVLIDEVDGLFLDNAGMVLYLTHNVDTLRFLERIFAQIWALANHPSFEKALPTDDRAIDALVKIMKSKIEEGEFPLPQYVVEQAGYMQMRAIIYRKLSIWVRFAFHAKILQLNNEYIIADQTYGSKKKKSITVMDKGTGVEQFSLKWSNGLHQFLQFKHGLEVAPDSLKAVFLSNFFFFKNYGQHIYGLSGTLGSETEQKSLQDLYRVDLCKIPNFCGRKYTQLKEVVTGNPDEWIDKIRESLDQNVKNLKRAVLIICDSIAEVKVLEQALRRDYPSLHIYTSKEQNFSFVNPENPTLVAPGDIIIATNLAGRGTDLKTEKELENNGGLHVILSYLPPNIRIQEQGFGRTARAFNQGTGEFIIVDSHRRPLSELIRIRDMEEKQRLENIATREIKKIIFENELLRGLPERGITGFQVLLEEIKGALVNEKPFYREAQLNSLKNRWAFWIDHMDEKIALVHVLGKEGVLASFETFKNGVRHDFYRGGHRLVCEPIELIKLGGEYRRLEMWSEAEACYAKAAEDPHYAHVHYYKAACRLAKAPTNSWSAKEAFKEDAKKAVAAIRPEINQLQTTVQNVAPLVDQRRRRTNEPDYGNPFKARTEERVQIWSIFLSAIDEAIGGTLDAEAFKKSNYHQEGDGARILGVLGDRYAPNRLSKHIKIEGGKVVYKNKTLPLPRMFNPILPRLQAVRAVTKETLQQVCSVIVTKETASQLLPGARTTVYRVAPLSPTFEKWPAGYSPGAQFILVSLVSELKFDVFASHQAIKERLTAAKVGSEGLKDVDMNAFFDLLVAEKLITEDHKIELNVPAQKFKSLKELKGVCAALFPRYPEELQEALFSALREKDPDNKETPWFLKSSCLLSDLALPNSVQEAADILWTLLEDEHVLKPPKVKMQPHECKRQIERIQEDVKAHFEREGRKDYAKVAEAMCGIIESCIGMIYKLESKKTTAKFIDIIRKYYHDHSQHAPEGLTFFVELGLEVIADLIEKKDPPAWFEVLAVTVLGVLQMVAGAIIKAYLPVVGELIGNALMSSGMDDVMFAITSAVNGEFSWDDYADHKVESLKRSITSSAISCGVSFAVSSVQLGVGQAWDVQKLSAADKVAKGAQVAGQVAEGGFNLGTHILHEVGRQFVSMGVSQIASRGIEGMTKLVAGSYENKVKQGVQDGVNKHWPLVVDQAMALHKKFKGQGVIQAKFGSCMSERIKRSSEEDAFGGAIRASRQALPQASSLIKDKGWGTFLSFAPDIANLGVSIGKLVSLVEDNVHELARDVRDAKDRDSPSQNAPSTISEAEFRAYLEEQKGEYVRQLTELFNGVLNSAVYAPLVSLGTRYLVEKANSALVPLSEQEKIAQSPEMMAKILQAESNAEEAFYDKLFRHWKNADTEVTDLSEEELKKKPINSTESIASLKREYGPLLKIYKDADGNLIAQRPSRLEYAQGVMAGKAAGDPEISALTRQAKKNIAIITPDGKTKTYLYSPDGAVEFTETNMTADRDRQHTIYLEFKPGTEGVGHVSIEGAPQTPGLPDFFSGDDCLYEAVNQAAGLHKSVGEMRQSTAETIGNDPSFKRFYHDWSLSSEPKQFAGAEPLNIGTRVMGGLGVIGSLGEIAVGGALSTASVLGIPGFVLGVPIALHGVDNLFANLQQAYYGQEVNPYTTQFLENGLGMGHLPASLLNDLMGIAGTAGGSAFIKAPATLSRGGAIFHTVSAPTEINAANTALKFAAKKEIFNFAHAPLAHMNNPDRFVPALILREVIHSPLVAPVKDPRGASEALMYYSQISKNGQLYNIEVLYDKITNTIFHFKYSRGQLGPLDKILK